MECGMPVVVNVFGSSEITFLVIEVPVLIPLVT